MRSLIWSILVCMLSPPSGCGCGGWLVMAGEHGHQPGERRRETPLFEALVRRVRQVLADDPGDEDGPVPMDLLGGQVGADQAAALQLRELLLGELDQPDGGLVRLRRRGEAGNRAPEQKLGVRRVLARPA